MKFADNIAKAYSTKWAYNNTFTVQIKFQPDMAFDIDWQPQDEYNINLNIVSIDTPQFTNQPIESYIGDRWKIHVGRNELYRFSITFRDQDQMLYYKKFLKAYYIQQKEYFDYVKMNITLWKDADYKDEDSKVLFDFEGVMIDAVSQLQYNNTSETQIAEFTVQFKCTTPNFEPTFKQLEG